MAINFLTNAVATPYIGRPFTRDVMLGVPRRQAAKTIPILIDWAAYGASSNNQRVSVSLSLRGTSGPNPLLEAVRSLYIDNTFSNITIYAFFLDCNYTVVCPPGAIVMQPVLTLDQNVLIYAEGFVDGQIPITQMQFLNTEEAGFYIPTTFGFAPLSTFLSSTFALGAASATINFANVNIGSAANDRLVIVGVAWRTGSAITITSLAADGIPMNIIQQNGSAVFSAGNFCGVALLYLRIPAGTNIASLLLTMSGVFSGPATNGALLSVWRMVNQGIDSPYVTGISSNNAIGNYSFTQNYIGQSSGIYLANAVGLLVPSWTNASPDFTTQYVNGGGSSAIATGARYNSLASEVRTVTALQTMQLVGAVWS